MLRLDGRPWKRACGWLLFLAPFFLLTYGGSNALAAQRHGVRSIAFRWERHIPFLPWTIVPYWSLDALYVFSVFACVTRAELTAHVRRLVTAQVVAVLCFVLFPLQFGVERPHSQGFAGVLFSALARVDRPFNQAPSLHIALLVIVWRIYATHVRSHVRWLLHAWCALIAVSVLTTYQHHVFDVPTGALVGLLSIRLWPVVDASGGTSKVVPDGDFEVEVQAIASQHFAERRTLNHAANGRIQPDEPH
jgi:membrane-associated phospholipid phosphatase